VAQYEKLINLSLLNQFLTKAKTIFAPKITASGILKGDGAGNVSAATAGTDYATPAQSLALGLTGTSVGDLVRVNAVDATGKPTSWKHVPLNEIKCNKNLLDNWYFVGGGSQLGDDVFPINQRGQTSYVGYGYGIDRWKNDNPQFNVDIASSAIKVYSNGNYNGRTISQYIPNASALLGKTITISIIINGALSYKSFKMPDELPENGTVGAVTLPAIDGIYAYLRVTNNKLCYAVFANSSYVAGAAINITACKLELGSEQTLAHQENGVWVLNEIPDYGEELAKCQRYYQLFRTESLRPTYGEDCRPTMATEQPTKGTLTNGAITYYTLSSEP